MNADYLSVAVDLAYQAGVIARKGFARGMRREWKDDGSPVTETDLAINQLVLTEICRRFPSHGVLAEEVSACSEGQEWLWVCDPIDGTLPFAHGIPVSAFSLALTRGGESVLGVVYDFHSDRLLTAVRGEGAFLNGTRIAVSSLATLETGVIDLEAIWTRALTTTNDLTGLPVRLSDERAKIIKLGSTVYAGMLVGIGELTGLVTRADKPWDLAALAVIVPEAGGRVTDLAGFPPRCDRAIGGAVVTNGLVHDRLLTLINA